MGRPMTYSFNKQIFDKIDTEEKAYWLGFIWCDGNVRMKKTKNKSGYTESCVFKLVLGEVDLNHVILFKNFIKSTHPIKVTPSGISSYKKCNFINFIISSNEFGINLMEKYGLVSNRQYCEKVVSHIPKIYYKDFIRGIIDADGSLTTNGKGGFVLKITTNENLLLFINQYLFENNLINKKEHVLYKRHKNENLDDFCKTLEYGGNNQVYKILKNLYEESQISLERKKQKYLLIIDAIENKRKEKTV
jgi:hypothetical protein